MGNKCCKCGHKEPRPVEATTHRDQGQILLNGQMRDLDLPETGNKKTGPTDTGRSECVVDQPKPSHQLTEARPISEPGDTASSDSSTDDEESGSDDSSQPDNSARGGSAPTINITNYNITGRHKQVVVGAHAKVYNVTIPTTKTKRKDKKKQRECSPTTVNASVAPPARERERFVSEYGKEDQSGVQATDDGNPKPGSFVLLGREPCTSVFDEEIKVNVAKSVGIIHGAGVTGTGFRVGPNFIMTAWHVVRNILENAKKNNYRPVTEANPSQFASLDSPDVYIDFGFLKEGTQSDMTQRFFFQPCVHFCDQTDCDFAVLELRDNDDGTMPEPFTYFSDPKPNGLIHLIGHSGGKSKHFATVKGIIDLNNEDNRKDLTEARDWSKALVKDNHGNGRDGYIGADNAHRVIFQCDFEKGASGSPGIVVLTDGRAVVVTMLVYGYPDWVYDDKVDVMVKQQCTSHHHIEQGVKLSSIYKYMSQSTAALADRDAIFGIPNDTI